MPQKMQKVPAGLAPTVSWLRKQVTPSFEKAQWPAVQSVAGLRRRVGR
jgi:hypothetical protein